MHKFCFVNLTLLKLKKKKRLLTNCDSSCLSLDNRASCRAKLQLLHWRHTAAPCPVCGGAGGELRWGWWLGWATHYCYSLHERPDQACRSHSRKEVQLKDDYDWLLTVKECQLEVVKEPYGNGFYSWAFKKIVCRYTLHMCITSLCLLTFKTGEDGVIGMSVYRLWPFRVCNLGILRLPILFINCTVTEHTSEPLWVKHKQCI